MYMQRTRVLELDFIRVISMILIIFCHMFAEAGIRWGEYFNVGVMVFMFMSGSLSYRAEYDKKWLIGKFVRILPEYYIYLALYLIVTIVFFHAEYSVKQIIVNIFLLQGFFAKNGLPYIGHLWFITYILICYALTPLAVQTMKKYDKNRLLILAITLQIAVVPLRIVGVYVYFSRFIAYFAGLYLVMKEKEVKREILKWDAIKRMALSIIFFNAIRFYLELLGMQDKMPKLIDKALGLIWQWAHMFLGIFLFYFLWKCGHKVINWTGTTGKELILDISSKSYCVYIVHQVFIYHDYAITRYVSPYFFGIFLALICIVISTNVLVYLSNYIKGFIDAD